MAAVTLVIPILPGKLEPWRRFCQVLQGSRRCQYEEFLERLGINKGQAWLYYPFVAPQQTVVVVTLEAEQPGEILPNLATSNHPFALWFRRQVLEFHGLDVTQRSASRISMGVLLSAQCCAA